MSVRRWSLRRVSGLVLVLLPAVCAAVLLVHLSTPRMLIEKDKLTLETVRRGAFQESLLATGQVTTGPAGPEVRATVDRYEASRLAVGQEGEVEIGGRRQALEITRIGSPESHNAEVAFRFAGAPPAVTPGQTLSIRLALGEPSESLLLARGAFFQATGGHWVWVVDETGGTAVRREIRLGRQNPEFHEILSGLRPGDRVITSTYDHLGDAEELVLID